VKGIPSGATVVVTCRGRGCPKALKGAGYTNRRPGSKLSLMRFLKRPLQAGTAITVKVSKAGAVSAIKTVTVRSGKAPTVSTQCQAPGAAKPGAC
jgi:hypothetical protein